MSVKRDFERLEEETTCPLCKEELDDVDGTFFAETSDTKLCPVCGSTIEYVMQYKRDYNNPYCAYIWSETYMKWQEVA